MHKDKQIKKVYTALKLLPVTVFLLWFTVVALTFYDFNDSLVGFGMIIYFFINCIALITSFLLILADIKYPKNNLRIRASFGIIISIVSLVWLAILYI